MFRRKPPPDGPVRAGDELACRMCGASVSVDETGRCPLGHRVAATVEPAAAPAPVAEEVADATALLTEAFEPTPPTAPPDTDALLTEAFEPTPPTAPRQTDVLAPVGDVTFDVGASAAAPPAESGPPAAIPALQSDGDHPYDDDLRWNQALPSAEPAPGPAPFLPAPASVASPPASAHATTERLAIDEIVAFELDASASALDVEALPDAAPAEAPENAPPHAVTDELFDHEDDAEDGRRAARRTAATVLGGGAALLAAVASLAVLPL